MSLSNTCDWPGFPPRLKARIEEHAKMLGITFDQAVVQACGMQFGVDVETIVDPWAGAAPPESGESRLTGLGDRNE